MSVNFMRFIAEELREYMAKLGIRTVDELVGRTDLLKVKDMPTSRTCRNTGSVQNPAIIRMQKRRKA